jgi:hypothetical protein
MKHGTIYVNFQNSYMRPGFNLHEIVETNARSDDFVYSVQYQTTGPICFVDTIKSLYPFIGQLNADETFFDYSQQDGATAHVAHVPTTVLHYVFGKQLI